MGDEPIQFIIHAITIDTLLNNIGLNIGDRLNFVTCEQTLRGSGGLGRMGGGGSKSVDSELC